MFFPRSTKNLKTYHRHDVLSLLKLLIYQTTLAKLLNLAKFSQRFCYFDGWDFKELFFLSNFILEDFDFWVKTVAQSGII